MFKLYDKLWRITGHTIAGGLIIDGIRRAIHGGEGNYQIAALEVIGSCGIEVLQHIDRKYTEKIKSFMEEVERTERN